jgi:Flp pilus assembly protein TadG
MTGRDRPRRGVAGRTGGRDRGSFALELVVLAPVLLLVVAFIVSVGRVTEGRARVQGAARDAVRAATINHNGNSEQAAREAYRKATIGMDCDALDLNPQQAVAGLPVLATARCAVNTIWGRKTITRTAQSVADTYRGTT